MTIKQKRFIFNVKFHKLQSFYNSIRDNMLYKLTNCAWPEEGFLTGVDIIGADWCYSSSDDENKAAADVV